MSETVIVVPQQVKVASFAAKRNATEDRIKQGEEEIRQLEEQLNKPAAVAEEADDGGAEPISAEEKTFKKRYGDLRRHSQKLQAEMQQQIDELKRQLESSTKKQIQLPKSEEEIAEWASQYPDVHKIIETIAIKKAKETSQGLEERMKLVDEMKREAEREKAEAELMRLHPDFDTIRDDDDFHSWVEEQPKWVQQALYDNDTDAKAAARAIDLYKADRNISKAKKPSDRGAAAAVSTKGGRTSPNGEGTEGVIYESQVAKMSDKEFEARYDEIMQARATGKFILDVSGAAR